MNYLDSISTALEHVLDWNDIPDDLLPLMIVSEATQLSATDSDTMGHATWH